MSNKESCEHRVGPFCAEGHHAGMPTDQECDECMHYKGKSRGVGDKLHKVLHTLGIDKVAETMTKRQGKSCGCGKRRSKLNKMFPNRA